VAATIRMLSTNRVADAEVLIHYGPDVLAMPRVLAATAPTRAFDFLSARGVASVPKSPRGRHRPAPRASRGA